MSGPAGPTALGEAWEACAVLERALVARAAERRSDVEARALVLALDGLVAAVDDPQAFVARDLALRGRIADASRSRHLSRTVRALHARLTDALLANASGHTAAERLARDVAVRRSLVDAIVRRDRDAAIRSHDLLHDGVEPR